MFPDGDQLHKYGKTAAHQNLEAPVDVHRLPPMPNSSRRRVTSTFSTNERLYDYLGVRRTPA